MALFGYGKEVYFAFYDNISGFLSGLLLQGGQMSAYLLCWLAWGLAVKKAASCCWPVQSR